MYQKSQTLNAKELVRKYFIAENVGSCDNLYKSPCSVNLLLRTNIGHSPLITISPINLIYHFHAQTFPKQNRPKTTPISILRLAMDPAFTWDMPGKYISVGPIA